MPKLHIDSDKDRSQLYRHDAEFCLSAIATCLHLSKSKLLEGGEGSIAELGVAEVTHRKSRSHWAWKLRTIENGKQRVRYFMVGNMAQCRNPSIIFHRWVKKYCDPAARTKTFALLHA